MKSVYCLSKWYLTDCKNIYNSQKNFLAAELRIYFIADLHWVVHYAYSCLNSAGFASQICVHLFSCFYISICRMFELNATWCSCWYIFDPNGISAPIYWPLLGGHRSQINISIFLCYKNELNSVNSKHKSHHYLKCKLVD